MKVRQNEIDIAKGIAIIFVVLGHLGFDSRTRDFLSSWHMPIFFITFGMVSSHIKEVGSINTWLHHIEKRFKSIWIPFFLWACIYAALPMAGGMAGLKLVLYGSNAALRTAGTASMLWFLPTMFCASMLVEVVYAPIGYIKSTKMQNVTLVAIAGILAWVSLYLSQLVLPLYLPLTFDVAINAVVFMIIGYLFKPVYQYLKERHWILLLFLSALLMIFTYHGAKKNGVTIMALHLYNQYGMFWLNACMGSFGVLALSILLFRIFGKLTKPLEYMGKHSLFYYGFHFIAFTFMKEFNAFAGLNPSITLTDALRDTVTTLLICTIGSLFCSRYIPTLEGK